MLKLESNHRIKMKLKMKLTLIFVSWFAYLYCVVYVQVVFTKDLIFILKLSQNSELCSNCQKVRVVILIRITIKAIIMIAITMVVIIMMTALRIVTILTVMMIVKMIEMTTFIFIFQVKSPPLSS